MWYCFMKKDIGNYVIVSYVFCLNLLEIWIIFLLFVYYLIKLMNKFESIVKVIYVF